MSHHSATWKPALALPPEEQESLVRFLAGREEASAGRLEWTGAFAVVAAVRKPADSKE